MSGLTSVLLFELLLRKSTLHFYTFYNACFNYRYRVDLFPVKLKTCSLKFASAHKIPVLDSDLPIKDRFRNFVSVLRIRDQVPFSPLDPGS
jgi:hypothetical protein